MQLHSTKRLPIAVLISFVKANKSATELPEVLEPKKSEYKNVSIFSLDSDLI